MGSTPPGPGSDPAAGDGTPFVPPPIEDIVADAITEDFSIARQFTSLQGTGGGYAKNAVVVDTENCSFTETPMDPIRRDSLSYWIFLEEEGDPAPTLRWARRGGYEGSEQYIEANQKILNIDYRTAANQETPSEEHPYGRRTETIRLNFKDVFDEAGLGTEPFLDYLRSMGYPMLGREYFDHALEYQEAYSAKENQMIYGGSSDSDQLISSVKFDYNFFTKLYEENLDRYNIPETLSPHIYTLYLEKERGLEGGDSSFYGDDVDVAFTEPRINQAGYLNQWTYNDFITLNRSEEMQRVFINSIRETSFSTDKRGEIDRGEYYDVWANRYPAAIAGSVETTAGVTDLGVGVGILSDKYRNILIPLTTEEKIHTSFNTYKELFPIFSEIQYSQTLPNQVVQSVAADQNDLPALNNLLRDVFVDFDNFTNPALEQQFSAYRAFAENHERLYTDQSLNIGTLPIGGTATRKIFNVGDWALGEEFVNLPYSPNEAGTNYLFLQNFVGERVESTLSDLILITRNPDYIEDTPTGLSSICSNMRSILLDLCNNHRRTYRDIMSGDRAYSEDVFFKVSKYFVSPEGVRSILPMQNFYLINDAHNRNLVNLIDTQLKYGRTYEYEISTFRLVIGTKTRIAQARYFNPETFTIRTDGEPGFRVTGRFEPVTMGEVTFLGDDDSDSTGISGEILPAEFLSDGEQIYLVDVDIELTPSIQIVELPYVSSTSSGLTVMRGTVLDDPPMPPEVETFSYRGVNNELLFLLNTGAGSKEFSPVVFSPQEQMYVNRLKSMNLDPNKITILYENDDPSTQFEVYRTDVKPRTYDDFRGKRLSLIDTRDELLGYRNASSTSYKSKVSPNIKYYYMFRAIDVHGHVSHPSPVYEIQLIDNDGAVYPLIKVIEMEAAQRRTAKTKKLNRFLKVGPAFLQSVLDTTNSDIQSPLNAPTTSTLPIGVQDVSVWGRTYKIRLTSRKTGRKLDLNIKCKQEYDITRPPDMPAISAGAGPVLPPPDLSGPADTTDYTPPADASAKPDTAPTKEELPSAEPRKDLPADLAKETGFPGVEMAKDVFPPAKATLPDKADGLPEPSLPMAEAPKLPGPTLKAPPKATIPGAATTSKAPVAPVLVMEPGGTGAKLLVPSVDGTKAGKAGATASIPVPPAAWMPDVGEVGLAPVGQGTSTQATQATAPAASDSPAPAAADAPPASNSSAPAAAAAAAAAPAASPPMPEAATASPPLPYRSK